MMKLLGRQEEFEIKVRKVRSLLRSLEVDGILISEQHGFAWITCGGDNHISLYGPGGSGSVLITEDGAYLLCSNVETWRLKEEEVMGLPLEIRDFNWHDSSEETLLRDILGSGTLGTDIPRPDCKDVSQALLPLRYSLLPQEVERMEWLGRHAESALRQACLKAEPGDSEFELAGRVAEACYERKLLPMLTLVAVEERIEQVRHPIPTDKEMDHTAMLVLCARRWGLYANLTRLIRFGVIDSDLRRRHDAVTRIDAGMIAASRVGTPYKDIFHRAVELYRQEGFPEDWRKLHQGGSTGYAGRYFFTNPFCEEKILDSQAIAWNPAIDGTKSEDTLIVTQNAITVVTEARDWPKITHEVEGLMIPRPDILVR